jgi:hypothetical protein
MGNPGIAVPSVGLGGTAGTLPGPTGTDTSQQPQQQDALKQILQLVMRTQQQKSQPQMVPTGVQAPPSQAQHQLPNFLGITAGVQAIYNHEKQKKLAEAKSDWNDLQVSMQKYIGQDGKVDPQAYSDPAVMQVLGNPKKLKEMAKALNQDWMNPEKTTVYGEALKASMAEQKQKHEAAAGLKQLFSHLIKRGQPTPQMNPDQQQQMASQVMSKAPISQAQPQGSLKDEADIVRAYADLTKAQNESRDKYDIKVGGNGQIVAVDKTDPNKSIVIKDENGKPIIGQTRAGAGTGKVAMVGQVPYGITTLRDGKPAIKIPGDDDWTGEDAKTFAAAKAASAAATANADHRAQVSAQARATAYASTREYAVINTDTNQLEMVNPATINKAPPGTYASGSQAMQVKNRTSLFSEIDYTAGQVNQAIAELPDTGFDASARAQLSVVLKSDDPASALQSFLTSSVAETLSDSQIKYVTGLVSLDESAMSLRSLGGMGSGSDQLRSAITKMLPGAATPSKKYAQRQMQLFQGEVSQLRKSLPKLGKSADADSDVETQTHNGHTYTRKKGSNDPWKLSD